MLWSANPVFDPHQLLVLAAGGGLELQTRTVIRPKGEIAYEKHSQEALDQKASPGYQVGWFRQRNL